ncbi:hypothetical protein JHK87_007578 [Glycine soja]|nr:hypothetical protein JHK87_007578 [Glycine soja]
MGTLIDKFDKHDSPIRDIHFHHSQPLFVSRDSFPRLFKFSEDKNKVSELGSWADMATKVA